MNMMGLEILLEAAKFVECKAEMKARGSPALPGNGPSSAHRQNNVFRQNGGGHYAASSNSRTRKASIIPQAVPESANGCKLLNPFYRRGQLDTSPFYEFNGGTDRASKRNNSTSSSSSGSVNSNSRHFGTRERVMHNKLEKNRRAHLRECFEMMKGLLSSLQGRRNVSNLTILRDSLEYIKTLKKREGEFEHEMERLSREKITLHQRLSALKKDIKWDHLDGRAAFVSEDLELDDQPDDPVDYSRKPLKAQQLVTGKMASSLDDGNQAIEFDSAYEESDDSRSYPISFSMNNGDGMMSENKHYWQIDGMSGPGTINLVTATKLTSPTLSAITVEQSANSPVGGPSFANCIASSPTANGFSVLPNSAMATNLRLDMGLYYSERNWHP